MESSVFVSKIYTRAKIILIAGTIFSVAVIAAAEDVSEMPLIISTHEHVADGEKFTFVKQLNPSTGIIEALILDRKGARIDLSGVPTHRAPLLDQDLHAALSRSKPGDRFTVVVALRTPEIESDTLLPSTSNTVVRKGVAVVNEKGEALGLLTQHQRFSERAAREFALRDQRTKARRLIAQSLIDRVGIAGSSDLDVQLEHGRPSLTLTLTKPQIELLVRTSENIVQGVELYREPVDTIADAMLDTGIDPHAVSYAGRTGDGVGIYMTESGCANAGHITGYTRLAGTRTDHAENVSSIMRAVSPDSHIYCRGGALLPTAADLAGTVGNPAVLVINRSNGVSGSNAYSALDRDWDNLVYEDKVVTFVSAGNDGGSHGEIISPAKGYNIVTVGNYNDANDTIWSTSSFVNSQLGNEKPEVSGPGVDIAAGGHTMTGTSMSSPHAAAFAADLLGAYTWLRLRPAYAKAYLLASSTKPVTGSAGAIGVGGLDFFDAYYDAESTEWSGPNNSFSYFDSQDSVPNNGSIERTVHLNSSIQRVRIVFSWLNRGTYTFAHRTDAMPLGMDFDITVLDPNGNVVGASASMHNPYELVEFDPQTTGTYVVKIQRLANRDTDAEIHAALSISW